MYRTFSFDILKKEKRDITQLFYNLPAAKQKVRIITKQKIKPPNSYWKNMKINESKVKLR